ncbi:MAG: hypothetical protein N2Z85_01810 [Patescibacteria group bacterium]|nr:hypothetical protein [Patescibacteria group bacterium]
MSYIDYYLEKEAAKKRARVPKGLINKLRNFIRKNPVAVTGGALGGGLLGGYLLDDYLSKQGSYEDELYKFAKKRARVPKGLINKLRNFIRKNPVAVTGGALGGGLLGGYLIDDYLSKQGSYEDIIEKMAARKKVAPKGTTGTVKAPKKPTVKKGPKKVKAGKNVGFFTKGLNKFKGFARKNPLAVAGTALGVGALAGPSIVNSFDSFKQASLLEKMAKAKAIKKTKGFLNKIKSYINKYPIGSTAGAFGVGALGSSMLAGSQNQVPQYPAY